MKKANKSQVKKEYINESSIIGVDPRNVIDFKVLSYTEASTILEAKHIKLTESDKK